MENKPLKIIGIQLTIFFIYTIISFSLAKLGGPMQLVFLFPHLLICTSLGLTEKGKNALAYWISFFLILLIGLGVCGQLPLHIG